MAIPLPAVTVMSVPFLQDGVEVALHDQFRVLFQLRDREEVAGLLIPEGDPDLTEVADIQPVGSQT